MADTKGLQATDPIYVNNSVNGQRTTALGSVESKEPALATVDAVHDTQSTREENSQRRTLFLFSEDAFLYILKGTFRKKNLVLKKNRTIARDVGEKQKKRSYVFLKGSSYENVYISRKYFA